jgi:NSS family neurotransmitter:Na+ symporter
MPCLAGIILILVIRSLTLPGAIEGVKFLFVPDFSKLSVKGVLDAMGHSFFSLSLGMGIMITYSSYMPKDADLPSATASIVTIDTGIAILAGLAIFPAVFALGFDPGEGAGLAFITLPGAFAKMPVGWLFSALFFLLIFFAALTSTMILLQVPLAYLEDEFGMSKKKAIPLICGALIILGIPAVLSFGPLSDFLIFGKNYFDFLDWGANNVLLPITALLGVLFVIFRYGVENSKKEFLNGAKNPNALIAKIFPFAVKFLAPIAIPLILLNATGLFQKIFS